MKLWNKKIKRVREYKPNKGKGERENEKLKKIFEQIGRKSEYFIMGTANNIEIRKYETFKTYRRTLRIEKK